MRLLALLTALALSGCAQTCRCVVELRDASAPVLIDPNPLPEPPTPESLSALGDLCAAALRVVLSLL